MDYFPIFLKLANRPVLVVGGGKVAARKAKTLLAAEAIVTVISPDITPDLNELLVSDNALSHQAEAYSSPQHASKLTHYALIFAATDQAEVNQTIKVDAEAAGVPINIVDAPDDCDFIMPSIVDRSPVVVAVSTGGRSPALARMIRARLEALIPASYGRLAELVDKYRVLINKQLNSYREKQQFWERTLDGKVPELVFSGRTALADQLMQETLETHAPPPDDSGEVYLVGAGPGDPDLLTFRALRLIQRADVVLYDRLVSDPIIALVRNDAEKIYVGKEKANHAVPQNQINSLLVKLAKQGKRVLRLKGGDPFIFGRGGEEIRDLVAENISFQVVPGITAAAGCGAYAGIPLTHRDFSQSVSFVTGHLKDGSFNLNWELLSQPKQTVVIYMGLTGLEIISQKLIEHGVPQDMPAALIQQGTTENQRVITATLSTLHDRVKAEDITPPTLVIIGEVVTLQDQLKWFDPSLHPTPAVHTAR